MAEKGFGVKEINLIGASGTPTIESPNNLNLNAVNVAISTNATIGGNLTVSGTVGIAGTLTYEDVTSVDAIGIITARKQIKVLSDGINVVGVSTFSSVVHASQFNGSGGGLTSIPANQLTGVYAASNGFNITNLNAANLTGTLPAISGANLTNLDASDLASGTIPDARFPSTLPAVSGANLTGIAVTEAPVTDYTISANGSSAYRIHGGGVDETANSPDLYLIRGQKYRFNNTTGSNHPFAIRVSNGGSAYTDGVSGSNQGIQFFTVPYDAPAKIFYQCTIHSGMVGNIYIRGANGQNDNVGVTTFVADTTFNGVKVGRGAGNDDKSTIVGYLALASNTTGYRNTAIGNQALNANLSGIDNTAIGSYSNRKNTTGNSNTSVGKWTMIQNINGHSNSVFGSNSLGICTSGFRNTILGYNSGSAIVDGSGNTIIGCNIAGSTSLTDTVIIGAGNGDERLRIDLNGKVMVGTTTPSSNSAAYMLTVADPTNTLGNCGITIRSGNTSGTTNQGSIFYSDATSGAGEYAGYLQYSHSTSPEWFRLGVASNPRFYVYGNGNAEITDGNLIVANGHGIDFSASAGPTNGTTTQDSELLDDYEEGKITFESNNSGLSIDTSYKGRYTKIGELVTVSGYIKVSSVTSSSNILQIKMPFTSAANSEGYYTRGVGATFSRYMNFPSNYHNMVAYVGGGENYMRFFMTRNAGGSSEWHQMVHSNLSSNSAIYFNVCYTTTS